MRRKEGKLKDKSKQLESRLEKSESTSSRLLEENNELKTEIESLESEINEVSIVLPIFLMVMQQNFTTGRVN